MSRSHLIESYDVWPSADPAVGQSLLGTGPQRLWQSESRLVGASRDVDCFIWAMP